MRILAFESSCDECAIAYLDSNHPQNYQQVVLSQIEHTPYAGVVPEVAARAHLNAIESLTLAFLEKQQLSPDRIDVVAATCGPGLIGGLLVGAMFSQALAVGWCKPFVPVHHLEAHILSPRLNPGVEFPYLALLTSGGHCQLIDVQDFRKYTILGGTLDDAAGEAFDKVARILRLGFPGGPAVERAAKQGDPKAFDLPKPKLEAREHNRFPLSFSGLKTAVARLAEKHTSENDRYNLAAGAQTAIVDQLSFCVERSIKTQDPNNRPWNALVIAGGVAANLELRKRLEALPIPFVAPPLQLCTDNAAMIAWAALEQINHCDTPSTIGTIIRPRWPLNELSIN